MDKTAAPPESEREANEKKAKTDDLASQLMDIDHPRLMQEVARLAKQIKSSGSDKTIVITGGAGSGKSTLAKALAKALDIKSFDLDEYVKGGYTEDRDAYSRRLTTAVYQVWMELPAYGWIVEHVEACGKGVVDLLRPEYAILVDPGFQHLKDVAAARNMVGKSDSSREKRALSTAEEAKKQFFALRGGFLPMNSRTLQVKMVES